MQAKSLPFLKLQTIDKKSWVLHVLSVRLEDYWKFVSDDNGHLRRCLFDSDGWDYLLAKQVDEQISHALADPAESWRVNNGVTLTVASAVVLGNMIQLQDIQLINGLLVTKIICRYCQCGAATAKKVGNIAIEVIVIPDAQLRDQVAKLTSIPGRPVEIDRC